MSKQVFEQANEAFVDEKYEEAHEFYTKALVNDDKTDHRFTSKILASRAQCSLKLKNYADALKDSNDAIQLDETNIKAYIRKGVSLYNQDLKEEALEVFVRGLEFDSANEQLKIWQHICEKELTEKKSVPIAKSIEKEKLATNITPVHPLPPAKIKHSFYQTDSVVTIQIPIKGLKKDQVQVHSTDTTIKINTKIPSSGHDYSLALDLAYPIDSSRTNFNVTSSNIEIKLYKRQAIQWTSLDAQSTATKALPPVPMSRPLVEKAPTYPSSSQRAKNWDKLEAEIKKDEKENKDDMGDSNAIFQRLYRDSDENTRRAMNKSMYESGGTCLNMNWEEVSKGRVTCEPPDGMEWKKYDSILCAFGWGPIGHSLVARLAQSQLESSTNRWIYNYIPTNLSGNLSAISSWPDIILYPDTNPFDYHKWQWSRQLHFVNIPDWNCKYISTRDCLNNRCIEGALKNYSQRLIDNNCDYVQQQQALFFLVHFLGDVHQPLHCGFKGDFGGNNVKGFFFNGTNLTNLHTIWDVDIINIRINRHFQSDVNLYYEYLKSLMFNQSLLINETYNDYKTWIDESVSYVCQQVYFDDNNIKLNVSLNFKLGEKYFNRNWPLIDQRLAQAGHRLASLLNQLAKNQSSRKLPPDTQALIIVLCVELAIGIFAALSVYLYKRRKNTKHDVLMSE
ncbi:unnamed protein product [Rotaria sordida]|uniref:Uncharacterized protein n=1 Tax=Rotaria sordida TaxID=392033 RepID=A0A813R9J8_9BILA|nr:unnamed protein product [Rotaria sordida]CAF1300860.1 unnamed protein product [Rotaria sordida]